MRADVSTRARSQGEGGQVIVLMALFLSLVGLAIVGTVLDFGLLAARNSAADAAAYLGAQAGGGTINDAAFSAGRLALVGVSGGSCSVTGTGAPTGSCQEGGLLTAAGACAVVAAANDAASSAKIICTQRGLTVTATVQQTVTFPVGICGVGGRVKSTRQAGPAYGTNHSIQLSQLP